MGARLIFVYNADSGLFNKATDFAHKLLSPATYPCNLCEITHGTFEMNQEWKTFIIELERDVSFLHKDEFENQYFTAEYKFPAVFEEANGGLVLLITDEEINRCNSIGTLKNLVLSNLNN